MTGMHMISCIRFSLQLLITESIYTFGLKRKKYFFWRILLGIVLYFGLALTTFYLLAGIPSENPFISIIYYSCMFVYSLITMNLCYYFQVSVVMQHSIFHTQLLQSLLNLQGLNFQYSGNSC